MMLHGQVLLTYKHIYLDFNKWNVQTQVKPNKKNKWHKYLQIRHIEDTGLKKQKQMSCVDVSLLSVLELCDVLLIFPLDLHDKIPFLFSLKCLMQDNPDYN